MPRAVCLCKCNKNYMVTFCLHLLKVDFEVKEGPLPKLQHVYFKFPSKFSVLGQTEYPTIQYREREQQTARGVK